MKFSVKQSVLLSGLEPVFKVADTMMEKEQKSGGWVTLTAAEEGLVAVAYNGKVAIQNTIKDYKVLDAGTAISVTTKDFRQTIGSFSSEEILTISCDGNELRVVPDEDEEQFQSLPAKNEAIELPKFANNPTRTISIKREQLAKAVSKVFWAVGDLKYKPEFFYWVVRLGQNKIRSVAGDGSRFVVYQVNKDDLSNAKQEISLTVHKQFSPLVNALLAVKTKDKDGAENEIAISEFVRTDEGTDETPTQTMLQNGNIKMILLANDLSVNWPDENKFITRKNTVKVIVAASELVNPVSGVKATDNDDVKATNKIHPAHMSVDLEKKAITIEAESTMKSKRKLRISDSSTEGLSKIEFSAVSGYIWDLKEKCGPDEFVQLEFIDNRAPLIAHYYAKGNVQDTVIRENADSTESYIMFFASFNKK